MLDEVVPEQDGGRGKVAAFPPRKVDIAAAVGGGDGDQRDMLVLHVLPGLDGDKGDADPGTDQLPHRFGAVAFQHDIGIEAGHFAVGIGDAAQVFALLQADELLLGDLIEGEGIKVRQRIGDGERQTDLLLDEGGAVGPGDRLAARKEGQITALAAVPYQIILKDVQTDIAVLLLEAAHQPRDEGGGGVHRKGHIHHAVFTGVVDLPVDGLQLLEDTVGVVEHDDAVFVQLDAFALAVKELDLQFVLQHADGTA